MTKTQDELLAAVERVEARVSGWTVAAADRASAITLFRVSDVLTVLAALRSPDPEVERLRGALEEIEALPNKSLVPVDDFARGACAAVRVVAEMARAALSSNSEGR